MARDLMMWADPLRGLLERVGPENRDFLGPEMATSEAVFWIRIRRIRNKASWIQIRFRNSELRIRIQTIY